MAFDVFPWVDRPPELYPDAGETLHEWFARITAYDIANPGVLTPLDAASMAGMETRLSAYVDERIAAVQAELAGVEVFADRLVSVIATGALPTGAEEAGSFVAPRTTRIVRVFADKACRVRIYGTAAARDADAARPSGTDPDDPTWLAAHGWNAVGLEVTLDGSVSSPLNFPLAPTAEVTNLDVPVADQLYYRIRNDGAAGAVNVTLTIERVE